MTPYDKLVIHLTGRHAVHPTTIPDDFDDVVIVHRILHDAEMSDHDYERTPPPRAK